MTIHSVAIYFRLRRTPRSLDDRVHALAIKEPHSVYELITNNSAINE